MYDAKMVNPPPKQEKPEEPYCVEDGERVYMAIEENPNGTCDVIGTSDRKTEDRGYRSFNLARCRNRGIAEVVMRALAGDASGDGGRKIVRAGSTQLAASAQAKTARERGYTGSECAECGSFTMKADGKCDTCGAGDASGREEPVRCWRNVRTGHYEPCDGRSLPDETTPGRVPTIYLVYPERAALARPPAPPAASGAMTHEALTTALRNIGYDITCGECASIFFTGTGGNAHEESCATVRAAESRAAKPSN